MANNVVNIFDKSKEDDMIDILSSFGIKVSNIHIDENDNFDTYSLYLSRGTRVSKVTNLLEDIGMHIGSYSVPTGEVSTSEGSYKIYVQKNEIPSENFSRYRTAVDEGRFSHMINPIPIGVGDSGGIVCTDLASLPNLLVGGVPGSGKSMLLHSILLSLIHNGSELYLADPKRVEFSLYDGAPGVKSVSYTYSDTLSTSRSIVEKMNNRFEILKKRGCRDYIEYNSKFRSKKMNPIVFAIDEWADLTLEDSSIEKSICSISQKGRAAGISVILTTQRPSAKVVSGLIKASFSGRICLKVNSSIDSRIVLDSSGAESIRDIGVGIYKDQKNHKNKIFRSFYIDDIENELVKSRASLKPLLFGIDRIRGFRV